MRADEEGPFDWARLQADDKCKGRERARGVVILREVTVGPGYDGDRRQGDRI